MFDIIEKAQRREDAVQALRDAETAIDAARHALYQVQSHDADAARSVLTGYSTGTASLIHLLDMDSQR